MLRRYLGIVMAVIMIWSLMPAIHSCAATDVKIGKAYSEILSKYQKAYDQAKNNDDTYNPETEDVNSEFFFAAKYEGQSIAYKIFDFNKDGTQELFIALLSDDKSYGTVFDAYTYRKGKAVRIVKKDIGIRKGSCIFCKNGVIASYSSGGASITSIDFQKMTKSQKRITTFLSLSYEDGICKKTQDGTTAIISYDEYTRMEAEYGKRMKITFYEYTDAAAGNIKEGKFTYNGQEAWKVTT